MHLHWCSDYTSPTSWISVPLPWKPIAGESRKLGKPLKARRVLSAQSSSKFGRGESLVRKATSAVHQATYCPPTPQPRLIEVSAFSPHDMGSAFIRNATQMQGRACVRASSTSEFLIVHHRDFY